MFKLLLELNYNDLENRTTTYMGKERSDKSDKVQITNMSFIPMQANGQLKIGANTTSNNGHDYWSTIIFSNIVYLNEDEPQSYTFKAIDNKDYIIEKVPRTVQCKVSCSCLDFYYRFAVWDHRYQALDGLPPPPYIRKTTTRPDVNPFKTPGLCKHIMAVVNKLDQEHFFA